MTTSIVQSMLSFSKRMIINAKNKLNQKIKSNNKGIYLSIVFINFLVFLIIIFEWSKSTKEPLPFSTLVSHESSVKLFCSEDFIENLGDQVTRGNSKLTNDLVKYSELEYDNLKIEFDKNKDEVIDVKENKNSGGLLEENPTYLLHFFKSTDSSNNFFLSFSKKLPNQEIQYYAFAKFNNKDVSRVGITRIRFEIKTQEKLQFCDKLDQPQISPAHSHIVIENGLDALLTSEFTSNSENNPHSDLSISASKNTPTAKFWYLVGTIYFFLWFTLMQGLLFLETIENSDKEMKLRAQVLFFISYFMIHFWMNSLTLFLTLTFHYLEFFSIVTRISSNISMLCFVGALFLSFTPKFLKNRMVLRILTFFTFLFAYTCLWLFVFYPYISTLIMFNSKVYAPLMYFTVISIILNFCFRVRVTPLIFVLANVAVFISLFGGSFLRPSKYFEAYGLGIGIALFVPQLFLIAIIKAQVKYGSRFILPNKCRRRKYESMTRSVRDKYLMEEYHSCQICTNSLDECEFEYADINADFSIPEFGQSEIGKYLHLDCGHNFHHNCLYKYQKMHDDCPVCDEPFPENDWDD